MGPDRLRGRFMLPQLSGHEFLLSYNNECNPQLPVQKLAAAAVKVVLVAADSELDQEVELPFALNPLVCSHYILGRL
jgi:hypothetical protein